MSSSIAAKCHVLPNSSLGSTSSSLELCSNQEEDTELKNEVFVKVDGDDKWGCCGFKPSCLQWMKSPILWLMFLVMFILLQGTSEDVVNVW